MGFGDAMKKLIGIEDIDEEDFDITDDEISLEKNKIDAKDYMPVSGISEPMRSTSFEPDKAYEGVAPLFSRSSQPDMKYSMNGSSPFKMIVIEPKSFDECSKLVDNLKSRKPVIINLEHVETDLARKIFDFLSGATCALSGNVQRVTQNIFIFAPANVDIAAKLGRRTEAETSKDNSPWR